MNATVAWLCEGLEDVVEELADLQVLIVVDEIDECAVE